MTIYDSEVPELEHEHDEYAVKTRDFHNLPLWDTFKKTAAKRNRETNHVNVANPYVFNCKMHSLNVVDRRKNKHGWGKLYHLMKVFIIVTLVVIICSELKTISQKRETANTIRNEIQKLKNASNEVKLEVQKIHDDLEYLMAKVRLRGKAHSKVNYAIEEEEHREEAINSITGAYNHHSSKIESLKEHIQSHHRAELIKRFGPGPYFVEFEVLVRGQRRFFTLRTAPIDDMPHSIFTFMDMVDRRVWDKTVFIHHWEHIIQAAPISSDGVNKREAVGGLLSFPEHGDFYRHEKYTVGFAGRPGGPEWYINLLDNYDSHGPGKQQHSRVLNDADPCFAEVVQGRDVIDLMQKISNEAKRKKQNGGLEFSSIESARIVVPRNNDSHIK